MINIQHKGVCQHLTSQCLDSVIQVASYPPTPAESSLLESVSGLGRVRGDKTPRPASRSERRGETTDAVIRSACLNGACKAVQVGWDWQSPWQQCMHAHYLLLILHLSWTQGWCSSNIMMAHSWSSSHLLAQLSSTQTLRGRRSCKTRATHALA